MTIYRFGPFRLEKEPLLLHAGGNALPLGPKVVETLLALLEHPGEVLSKGELLARVWPEGFVEEANLAQNIYVIRKALRSHWGCCPIETVPRRGYRFAAAVTTGDVPPTAPAPVRNRNRLWLGAAAAAAMAVGIAAATIGVANSRVNATPTLSEPGARLYAMGNYYWNQRTESGTEKSIRYFEAVVKSDPRDALGYAGLASAYAIDGDYHFGPLSKAEAFARASQYARRALDIDPNSAEAMADLGLAQVDAGQEAAGEVWFRRAIAADRSFAPAHQWYGMSLLRHGNGDAAYRELQRAANLDPESVAATDWLSEAAYLSRRYSEAISYARQTLDLSSERYDAYSTMGMAYEALGNYPKAISSYETFERACGACRGEAAALLAHVYAAIHDDAAAQAQLDTARAALATRTVDPEDVLTALVAMGRRAEALKMLEEHKRLLDPGVLAIDPRMDPVRDDKRFRAFIKGPG